jgi:hypothetical protein
MSNQIDYQHRITEIANRLELGHSNYAIIQEYIPKWGVSRRTIERYIALAQDVVGQKLRKREKVIQAVRADIIAHEAETWMKSNMELEARLCAIISGKSWFYKTVKKGSDTQQVKCLPTCREVILAIDLLLKMRKAYNCGVAGMDPEKQPFVIIVDNEEEKKAVERIAEQGRITDED